MDAQGPASSSGDETIAYPETDPYETVPASERPTDPWTALWNSRDSEDQDTDSLPHCHNCGKLLDRSPYWLEPGADPLLTRLGVWQRGWVWAGSGFVGDLRVLKSPAGSP